MPIRSRDFREALIATKTLDKVFGKLDQMISRAGYLPQGGQIVDATLVSAPKQRQTKEEKEVIMAGETPKVWQDNSAKMRQKDREARWTVKYSKPKHQDGIPIAIPVYGYKNHVSVDRKHKIIRKAATTHAARHDGALLRQGLIDKANTASDVWADSAYRSADNEAFLVRHGLTSRIHKKKPRGKPMPKHMKRGNATRSKIRARVEHVFATQKYQMKLFIRTIGMARAHATLTLANIAYNLKRFVYLHGTSAPA